MIRVAVFDAHPLFREGVVLAMNRQSDIEVVAVGSSAEEAVQISAATQPDVLLIDVAFLDACVEAASDARFPGNPMKLIVLTGCESDNGVGAAIAAGVCGYVLKGTGGAELAQIVRSVTHGSAYVSPELAAHVFRQRVQTPNVELSRREVEILRQASLGFTNKEIARVFELSEPTIKYHMAAVLVKFQVRNRIEAIMEAHRRGLLNPVDTARTKTA